jgi:hypothetical protein
VVDLFSAKEAWKREVVHESIPALESDRVLVLVRKPNPRLDIARLMERENARSRKDPSLRRARMRLVRYTRGSQRVLMFERHGKKPPFSRQLTSWELGWLIQGEAKLGAERAGFYLALKPYADGPRRVHLIETLRARLAQKGSQPLLFSLGNETATREMLDSESNRIRLLDFQTLARLRYDALLPGKNELFFGTKRFLQQAKRLRLPYLATNLRFKKGERKGRPLLPRYRFFRRGGAKVVVLGVVDPALPSKLDDPTRLADLEIRDPVTELTDVIDHLSATEESRPDLVIVLAAVRPKTLRQLQHTRGVDVILGEMRGSGRRLPVESVDISAMKHHSFASRGVAMVARSSYAHVAQLTALGKRDKRRVVPTRLTLRRHLVDSHLLPDRDLLTKLSPEQQRRSKQLHRVLLPPLETVVKDDARLRKMLYDDPEIARWLAKEKREQWQLWFTARLWTQLVANLLLDASGAEVTVVARPAHLNSTIPGRIIEHYVLEWLPRGEKLLAYRLTGAQLRTLFHELEDADRRYSSSGYDPKGDRVFGRKLQPKERYRVLLTKSIASMAKVRTVLAKLTPESTFRSKSDGTFRAHSRGRALTLASAVLTRLRALRKRYPNFGERYRKILHSWLCDVGQQLKPQWSFAARGITVSFSTYRNDPSGAWSRNPGIRETRAVTPNLYTIGLRGELALVYDSANLAWESKANIKFDRSVIELTEDIAQEGTDDWTVSSELRLKLINLELGKKRRVSIVPYTSLTFDSELTPTENQLTGERFPHQKELRAALGLVSYPGSILREIRLAGIFKKRLFAG